MPADGREDVLYSRTTDISTELGVPLTGLCSKRLAVFFPGESQIQASMMWMEFLSRATYRMCTQCCSASNKPFGD